MAQSVSPDGYERSDVTARTLVWIALGIALFLLVVPFVIHLVFHRNEQPLDVGRLEKPAEPRLQVTPLPEIDNLKQANQRQLEAFGPASKQDRFHIPLNQAKARIVVEGLPGWPHEPIQQNSTLP